MAVCGVQYVLQSMGSVCQKDALLATALDLLKLNISTYIKIGLIGFAFTVFNIKQLCNLNANVKHR